MPEQHVQPHVDARLVDNRHVHGQLTRTLDGSGEQPSVLRELGELAHETLVEHGETGRLEQEPVVGHGERRLSVPGGRPEYVALAEQLGAEALLDSDPCRSTPSRTSNPSPSSSPAG